MAVENLAIVAADGAPSLAREAVQPHLATLRWCGFCRLSPRRAAHDLYCWFALLVTTTYLLQECVYAYQERDDMDKLARVMFLLLCHVTSIVKQIVFHTKAHRIDLMVISFDEPAHGGAAPAEWRRALLEHTARSMARLQRAYAGTAVLTCTLWIVFPIMYYMRGQNVEFPFWTGVDYSHLGKFSLVLVYSYYVTTLVGIANTTMDAFVATVLFQCKTQLSILRANFETLSERAVEKSYNREQYDFILNQLFLECLDHYKKITVILSLLQDIFGSAILIQFGIGGWILCMAAYKLVSSDKLMESMYRSGWLGAGLRFQRALLLAMERAKRPLRPAAGLIIPLSLDTFVKILKSSYTFYAVLRQTK
ncbi:uncharacterized protein LOC128676766 isoform X2 [Plodia interpunctella]|uniref:uncharacterized protein LOC128676766 isoform X2 n=1 Tax=Plodia interpunctella TaxID=58824 RepID=UPI00236861F8|nr:uncharacterized protein LOC128676766 isoform X2 [Plodia interpunctella]